MKKIGVWIKSYSLGIILALAFFGSWYGQYHFQLKEYKAEVAEHHQPVVMSEFYDSFWSRTFENWQSEFWQVFWFVVLTKYFFFRGSNESKEIDENGEVKSESV